MLTGRVLTSTEGLHFGLSQYLVGDGEGMEKAEELAQKISNNAGMTNYALMHVLPRIVEAGHESGLMMESLMAAIAQDAPEAKERLQDFLAGRAKKVGE
jgi:(methylthio)acryloyl-CoA hydratase